MGSQQNIHAPISCHSFAELHESLARRDCREEVPIVSITNSLSSNKSAGCLGSIPRYALDYSRASGSCP